MNLFLHFLKIEDSFIDIIITFLKNHPTFKNLIISLFTVFITLLGREILIWWRKKLSIKNKRKIYIELLNTTYKKDLDSLLKESKNFGDYLDNEAKQKEHFTFKKYSFENLDLFNFYNSEDLFLICKKESNIVLKIFELNSNLSVIKIQLPYKINIDREKYIEEYKNNLFYLVKQEKHEDDRKQIQSNEILDKVKQFKNRMDSLKKRNEFLQNNIQSSIKLSENILEKLDKNFNFLTSQTKPKDD